MEMMQHYFEQISRPSSPHHGKLKHQWFSTPPRFQIHDEDVVNLFSSVTKHHLTKDFPILADFPGADNPRKELHLAYAAVGGLFCNIPGRFKVVNSMYNDARRMLLDPVSMLHRVAPHHHSILTYATQTHQEVAMSVEDKLSAVKTVGVLP